MTLYNNKVIDLQKEFENSFTLDEKVKINAFFAMAKTKLGYRSACWIAAGTVDKELGK